MSELSLFAKQLVFWALLSLKPFAKRTSDNPSFYANEKVKRSLCCLPLGKPSPPSPLTSQRAWPEGSWHWTLSVKSLHCRGPCWHRSQHWDCLFLQSWSKCPGILMPSLGRREEEKFNMAQPTPYREKDTWLGVRSHYEHGLQSSFCDHCVSDKIYFLPLQHGQTLHFFFFLVLFLEKLRWGKCRLTELHMLLETHFNSVFFPLNLHVHFWEYRGIYARLMKMISFKRSGSVWHSLWGKEGK